VIGLVLIKQQRLTVMEKTKLEKFISKYSLGGSCESVLWKSDGNDITVKCISDDKNVLGIVTVKDAKLDEGDYGIFDTKQLSSMLSVLGEAVTITTKKVGDRVSAIHLTDSNAKVDYVLADSAVIPAAPDLKQLPAFDIEIKLDQKVMNTFLKARGALSDVETFTVLSDGDSAQIVLGYSDMNTNRITLDVETTKNAKITPINFSARYFKEIIAANKEAASGVLKVSSKGLAYVKFGVTDYNTDYYLVQIQTAS
jgi:hypothetical protein